MQSRVLLNIQPDGNSEFKMQLQKILWSCYWYLTNLTSLDNAQVYYELENTIAARFKGLEEKSLVHMQQRLVLSKLAEDKSLNGSNASHVVGINIFGHYLSFHYQKLSIFEESILLLKIAKTSKIHDLLSALERKFGSRDFEEQLTLVENFLNDADTIATLSKPRKVTDPETKPEETNGAKLLATLTEQLKKLRESYLDLHVPANEAIAKQLLLNKINAATLAFAEFLDSTESATPDFHAAKKTTLQSIQNELIQFQQNGIATDETINAIDNIRTNAKTKLVFTTHTWGLFTHIAGTPRSDQYIEYLDKQFNILAQRKAILHPEFSQSFAPTPTRTQG